MAQAADSSIQVLVRRFYTRQMREEAAQHQMVEIQKSVGNGWKLTLEPINEAGHWFLEIENGAYPTDVEFSFKLIGPVDDTLARNNVLSALSAKLAAIKTGTGPEGRFRIHLVDGVSWKPMKAIDRMAQQAQRTSEEVSYADVTFPEDARTYFEDIYDCDAQVNIVLRKFKRVIGSDFQFRDHCLLVGQPGAAKSFTLQLAAQMFGKDAILRLDGTAMTSAGIIDILKDIPVMPRFIFIEEIDKANDGACAVLLGLMDKYGEIRKTTFKKDIQREARVCVFATANNMDKVDRMQEGALSSRFGNPVTYQRPNEAGLRRILHRELTTYGLLPCCKPVVSIRSDGTEKVTECLKCKNCQHRNKWINATLDWCKTHKSEMKSDTEDPRFIIEMCILGQDDLLSGDYQRDIEATSIKVTDYTD
jgi:hypothetical protein